jgi:hypothetical protein
MCFVSSRAVSSLSLGADIGYACSPPPLTGLFPARAEEPGPAWGALHQAQGQDHPRRGAVSVAFRHQVDGSLEPTWLTWGASMSSLLFLLNCECLGFRLYFCRLLAREGINAEQLARDLKSFELKVMDGRVKWAGNTAFWSL